MLKKMHNDNLKNQHLRSKTYAFMTEAEVAQQEQPICHDSSCTSNPEPATPKNPNQPKEGTINYLIKQSRGHQHNYLTTTHMIRVCDS